MTPFSPVRSPRLSEVIIRQIAQFVEAGRMQINDRFPSERTLETQWKVSRPVLREAFRALEMQGMIESRPGGGRYLRSVMIPEPAPHRLNRLEANRENLLHVWDARESIEVKAAELAARHATAKEIRALGAPLDRLVKLPAAEVGSIDFNREFHLVIARDAQPTDRGDDDPVGRALKRDRLQGILRCRGFRQSDADPQADLSGDRQAAAG